MEESNGMKIILVAPKRNSMIESPRLDYAFWNFYIPLLKLGHEVKFFDTSLYGNKQLKDLIGRFEPDLLFCIMTGSPVVCPDEPWQTIQEHTEKGDIKTFNWFCDDSYRFESFSKEVCHKFNWCSTPENKFVDNYRNMGYENITYATFHVNVDLYSSFPNSPKKYDRLFIGGLHGGRVDNLNFLAEKGYPVAVPSGNTSFEDMVGLYSQSNLCLNFTKDSSGNSTQMKARIFEVIATGSMLLTEFTNDLDNCFDEGELLHFSSVEEAVDKLKWIKSNPKKSESIMGRGLSRVVKDHDSSVRLRKLLEEIA